MNSCIEATAGARSRFPLASNHLEVHGTYELITVLLTLPITMIGHLRGFDVGCKYSYNWKISSMNLQAGEGAWGSGSPCLQVRPKS